MLQRPLSRLASAVLVLSMGFFFGDVRSLASGGGSGGGGSVETIKVIHCEYAVTTGYVELLISASSSTNSALYAYLPDGELLGQVFAGGRYGGTVFLTPYAPDTITLVSSSGAHVTVPCVPFQP